MNIYDELIDWQEMAAITKAKIAAKNAKKKAEPDGAKCFICKNFVLMAANNCNKGFVCWSCNNGLNQTIYDYELV